MQRLSGRSQVMVPYKNRTTVGLFRLQMPNANAFTEVQASLESASFRSLDTLGEDSAYKRGGDARRLA